MAGDALHAGKLMPPVVLPVPLQPMVQAGAWGLVSEPWKALGGDLEA